MSENTEIMAIPQGQAELVVSDKSIELIIAEAERRVEVLKKVLGVAIKRTNATDWVDQQGKPYLTASGCEKVAPLFGLKMEGVVSQRDEREDEKGKYYMYTFMARFFWAAGDIEAIGTCSSRDKFFAWDSGSKAFKALHDVDETNIKKAAYSNLIVNGVTRSLGIRNLTWQDLEPFGIKKDSVSKVEYNKGANADPANQGVISEGQVKRLYAIAKSSGWAEQEFKDWLLKEYHYESTKQIHWKKYDEIVKKCQEAKGVDLSISGQK